MNYVQLFVDNVLCDTGEEELSIPITYQLIDSKDLNSRAGSRTKTITIPRTAKNDKIFGFAGNINALNQFSKYDSREVRIEDTGIVIFDGLCQLTEVTRSQISLVCFGELSKFKGITGDKTLRDLMLVDLNHTYDATVFDTWNGIYPAGVEPDYFYPLIDYGHFLNQNAATFNIAVSDVFPAMYIRRLVEQICRDNGYTLDTTFFDNPVYGKILLPFGLNSAANSQEIVRKTAGMQASGASHGLPAGTTTLIADFENYDPENQFAANEFISAFDQVVHLTLEMFFIPEFSISGNEDIPYATLTIEKYTTSTATWAAIHTRELFLSTEEFDIVISNISLLIGDGIRLRGTRNVSGIITYNIQNFEIKPKEDAYLVPVGGTIELAQTLPAIKQSDFFKWCAQLFNWIIEVNPVTSVIHIETYDKYYVDSDILDYSNKLSLAIEPVINYQSPLFSRKYDFKYKRDDADYFLKQEDGDSISQTGILFGDGKFYLSPDGEAIQVGEVGFAPTVIISSFSGDLDLPGMVKIRDTLDTTQLDTKTEPRLLINAGLQNVSVVSHGLLTNLLVNSYTKTQIPFCYFTKKFYTAGTTTINAFKLNLGFSVDSVTEQYQPGNLIDEFYRSTIESLSVSALVTAYFNLTVRDINTLDFSKLWYLDEFNAIFKVNKIEDYQPGRLRSTKVELIKVGVYTGQSFDFANFDETTGYLLLEDGGYLLLEDGGKLILE